MRDGRAITFVTWGRRFGALAWLLSLLVPARYELINPTFVPYQPPVGLIVFVGAASTLQGHPLVAIYPLALCAVAFFTGPLQSKAVRRGHLWVGLAGAAMLLGGWALPSAAAAVRLSSNPVGVGSVAWGCWAFAAACTVACVFRSAEHLVVRQPVALPGRAFPVRV